MEQILLPEHYFENIKIEAVKLIKLHNKDSDMIRNTSRKDQKIININDALNKGIKEIKGIALGLCEWREEHLWYQGKIWVPEDEGLQTTIISQCHDHPLAGYSGTAKTTELITRQYYWPRMRETIKQYMKTLRHMPTEQSSPSCTIWPFAAKQSSRPAMAVYHNGLHYRLIKFKWI